jgi:hypothetical protein
VECLETEEPLDCAKRALMAGDWDQALEIFLNADNNCEAIYGRYLARMMMIYTDYCNLIFSDFIDLDYNRHHLLRDLVEIGKPGFVFGHHHFSCLARASFWESPKTPTLVERDLELIWENQCTLAAPDGGPLPIRLVIGFCEDPLIDMIALGIWDPVDAVAVYQLPYGAPPLSVRFQNIFDFSSCDSACKPEDVVCEPMEIDGKNYPRLPADSERFLSYVYKASLQLFEPSRSQTGVVIWDDADGNCQASPMDRVYLRFCDTLSGEPIFNLTDVNVAATWEYKQAPSPIDPALRTLSIFCGDDEACPVLDGEIALPESPPLRIPNWDALSPDGTQIAFLDQNEEGEQHIFLTGIPDASRNPVCESEDSDCCLTCLAMPDGIATAKPALVNMGRLPQWISDPQGPDRPPLGLFYMHLDHPSGWGWQGECQGMQFYAIRPDGTGNSALLPDNIPPYAFNYQAHVSPDGSALLWTSTWDPKDGTVNAHKLLLANIVYDQKANQFSLENIHSILSSFDHGWYEAHHFSSDYPHDRRIFFSSTAHSMQSVRGFIGELDETDAISKFYKINWPEEVHPGPFMIDYHPAWNEHFKSVDHGKQVIWISSDASTLAAERYDWLLNFPPYLEGLLLGYTVYQIRHIALGDFGYLSPPIFNPPIPYPVNPTIHFWIANIDGSNLEVLAASADKAGWHTTAIGIQNGDVYLTQKKDKQSRFGVIRFQD